MFIPRSALAERGPFRFLHTQTHPRRRRGQQSRPVRAQTVFHTVTCTGLSTPHLRSTLPISCFWPRDAFPPSHAAQLMVEHFLAVANFLLPQSTSSSRSLLALHTLMPRLLSSSASSQPDLSRVQHSKGKGKAVLGDDHGSFERSDWLHIAHRKSS